MVGARVRRQQVAYAVGRGLASVDAERRQLNARLKALAMDDDNKHTILRPSLATDRTAWDRYELLSFDERRVLVQVLFDRLELNETGIFRYVLRRNPQGLWTTNQPEDHYGDRATSRPACPVAPTGSC
jgi:hypothetical protein